MTDELVDGPGTEFGPCIVCHHRAKHFQAFINQSITQFECDHCGKFNVPDAEIPLIGRRSLDDLLRLSCALREKSRSLSQWEAVTLSLETVDGLLADAPSLLDVPGRGRKLLKFVAKYVASPEQDISLDFENDCLAAYGPAHEGEGLLYICQYLKSLGLVEFNPSLQSVSLSITPAGWKELEQRPHIESDKAFVAQWFSSDMNSAYIDAIESAIRECGYKAIRIDLQEHNEGIVDRIIAEIKESRFVVADLTGNRGGVYFEAGFAKGLGREVILTCRHGEQPHFDVQHLNQIRWSDHADLKKRITDRIRATIGKGPLAND